MTTEQAIKLLHRLQDEQFDGIHGDERREALEMAVRALEGDGDTISRQQAIEALWKALYEYEDKTEKQFIESDELDVSDWIVHRVFVQNMSDIDRRTILDLPSAQPEGRKGVFIPDITVEMFRNASLEGVENLLASGEMEDISLPSAQPERDIPKHVLWTGWKGCRARYKCPNCKKPVRNDDVYCHRCGQKLMFPHISFTDYIPGEKQELIVRWDDEAD